MDKFSLHAPNFFPAEEYFSVSDNNTCTGCGTSLAVRQIGKALEERLASAHYERTSGKGPLGYKTGSAYLRLKTDWGDCLFCLDDEPLNELKESACKTLPFIAVEKKYSYVATASPSYPFDFFEKVKRAFDTKGKSFVHILCPCPAGWEFPTEDTVKMGFYAVESRAFPLFEISEGNFSMTNEIMHPRDVTQYIKAQGRFSNVTSKELRTVVSQIGKEYARLEKMVGAH